MRKFLAILVILFTFMLTVPLTAEAHNGCRRHGRSHVSRNYNRGSYQTRGYSYQRPSFYRRHRNLMNIGIATGGGALLGGLIGGNRKGMAVGALVGAGSGALYTYVLKPKNRRY